jgi:hypothetical protein
LIRAVNCHIILQSLNGHEEEGTGKERKKERRKEGKKKFFFLFFLSVGILFCVWGSRLFSNINFKEKDKLRIYLRRKVERSFHL